VLADEFGLRAFDDDFLISIKCVQVQLAKYASTDAIFPVVCQIDAQPT